MKKIILSTAALALFATAVEARDIPAGSIMVTGDTNIEISSSEIKNSSGKTTTDSTEINLAGAYFVANNFGVGLMLGVDDSEVDDGNSVSEQSLTMVGPIVGYNISLNSNTSIMLNAALFLANGDLDDGSGFSADIDGDGYMIGGSINYFLNDNVALNFGLRMVDADIELSYAGNTVDADLSETATSIGLATYF